MTFVWRRITVRDSSDIPFFCREDSFCKVVRRPENTYGKADRFVCVTNWPLPSVQNYGPYIVFTSTTGIYDPASSPAHFLFMAGYRNLHTSVFFPVICWSYLRTEISITLSIGNELYSRHHLLSFFYFLWNHFVDVILRLHWIN